MGTASYETSTDSSGGVSLSPTVKLSQDKVVQGSPSTDTEYGTLAYQRNQLDTDVRWQQRFFPTGFRKELRGLFSLAWPAGLAALFCQSFGPVSLMFSGQLGRVELDGVGMALSLLNITGLAVGLGLITACDTLFSQAYGGKKKHLVGIYLQRSLIIISISVMICWAIHLNTEALLILLGQNKDVARADFHRSYIWCCLTETTCRRHPASPLTQSHYTDTGPTSRCSNSVRVAGQYLLYFMPGLLFNFIFQVFVKYLQNQNLVLSAVVLGLFGNIVNALAQYLAIHVLQAGIVGSSVGQVVSYFIMMCAGIAYVIASGLYKETWTGWSWEALEQWGQFSQLAIAGMIMIAIEWWCLEIGIFLNGLLGELELGATSVVFQMENLIYCMPYGIGISSSIRVGHSLGAGNAKAAKTTANTAQVFAWMAWIVVAIILGSLKDVLPLLFTNDAEVVSLTSKILPILIFNAFLDSIVANSMGTLRGSGRQWTGAICNSIGYIGVAVPVAVVLMFVVRIGALGFWWGMCIGISVSAIIYIFILLLLVDWDKEVIKAEKRIRNPRRHTIPGETQPLIHNESSGALPGDSNGLFSGISNGSHSECGRKFSNSRDYTNSRKLELIAKRSACILVIFAVLIAGVCVRLFVPLPGEPWYMIGPADNYTITSELTQTSTSALK